MTWGEGLHCKQAGALGEASRPRSAHVLPTSSHRENRLAKFGSHSSHRAKVSYENKSSLGVWILWLCPDSLTPNTPGSTLAGILPHHFPKQLSLPIQVSVVGVESPPAGIPEDHGKSELLLAYSTHPLPQEPFGPRNESWCPAALCTVPSFLSLQPSIFPLSVNAFSLKIFGVHLSSLWPSPLVTDVPPGCI